MKTTVIHQQYFCAFALLLSGAALLAGCSSDRHKISAEDAMTPKPPAFLIGPAGVLLTNASSYSARLTVEHPDATGKVPTMSGHLLSQGGHLLYAPDKGDKIFIWDVQAQSGYILSEALQGYAPVSSPAQFSNVITTSAIAGSASERVNGHPGHEAEISITSDDGSTSRFNVWRAADFDGLAVHIKTLTASAPFELNLSELRHETLPPTLFLPPDGFAGYGSPELMNTELLARKSKLRNPGITPKDSEEPQLPQHKNL